MTTEAAKAAKAKYDAKTARYFSLKLNRNTNSELIKHLENQKSIQSYLKRLIWEDMNQEEWLCDHDNIICPVCKSKYKNEILYFASMDHCPGCGAAMKMTAHD